MASGPWDNVSLASPPNNPAYLNAFSQLMNSMGNNVNNAFNQYQQGQNFANQQALFPYQLQQAQRQQNLNQLFQNGVPQLPNGQIDYNSVFKSMLQAGGAPEVGTALQALPAFQKQQLIDQYINGGQTQPTNTTTPTAVYGVTGQNSGPRPGGSNEPRYSYRQSGDDSEETTLNTLAAEYHVDKESFLQAYPGFKKLVGKDLTDDQIRTVQSRMSQFKQNVREQNPIAQSGGGDQEADRNHLSPSMGEGNSAITPRPPAERRLQTTAQAPVQSPQPQAAPIQQLQPQPQPQQQNLLGAAAMVPPQFRQNPVSFADYLDQRADQLTQGKQGKLSDLLGVNAQRDVETAKGLHDRASKIREQAAKDATTNNPQLQSTIKANEAVGGALGKRQGEVVEAGGIAARHTINTIDEMQDAFRRSAGKMTEGPYAEQSLKFKQAANNIFPGMFDQNAIVDATAITKLNAQLAAEAAKAMTARPSQLEFRAFMQNNPGLATGVDGGLFLSEVIKRAKQQDIKLSGLAAKTPADQWPSVEEKFFNDPKNQLFTEAERKNPYLVIGQKGPSSTTQPKIQPGGWQEIAPGIRIRPKPNPADQT